MKDEQEILDGLEFELAEPFHTAVTACLRRLNDTQINTLYLMTHTDHHCGDRVASWTAVLMPIIEEEFVLRRHISVVPSIGPTCAPELYAKGGGHDVPF